jgi:hypothetical protein
MLAHRRDRRPSISARLNSNFEADLFPAPKYEISRCPRRSYCDSGRETVESLRVPAEAMPEADAVPVISYQARSYNVFDEQTKDAAV